MSHRTENSCYGTENSAPATTALNMATRRAIELSPHDDVTVLARVSAHEAAVEINCRTRELAEADVELPRLLVRGNSGRLLLITRGALRGSLVTIYLPLDPERVAPTSKGEAETKLVG